MAKKKKSRKKQKPMIHKIIPFHLPIPRWVYVVFAAVFVIELGWITYSYTHFLQDLEEANAITVPRAYLRERAQAEGIDTEILERIAWCESHWRMVANKRSSAYGYFQILDATEKTTPQYKQGLRKFDPFVNIDMAISLYKKRGTSPWNESKACWGHYLN